MPCLYRMMFLQAVQSKAPISRLYTMGRFMWNIQAFAEEQNLYISHHRD
jgi:hypothetical protein